MAPFPPCFPAIVLVLCLGAANLLPAQETLTADLDPFITLPGAYRITPDDLEKQFEQGDWTQNPYFKWLTEDRSRAVFQRKDLGNLKVDLTLIQGTVPIEEMIVDFENGALLGVTISVFNRGDGGAIPLSDFEARKQALGRHLGSQLDVRPTRRKAKPTQGLLTDGFLWISARGKAVLEHNHEAPGKTEFLRMRLARRDAGGAYEAAMQSRAGASVKLSQLPDRVVRDEIEEGGVSIRGIPMVDQGAKGYCVVASVQRLFEYYGIPCDMHQLAQIAGSDPDRGTNILAINEELGAIDHLFKTRFNCLAVRDRDGLVELVDGRYVGATVPEAAFHKMIGKSIDAGIPLLWALEVGAFPETPPLQEQTSGGHMRMITGYNSQANKIYFSDSWGAGHERKEMDANHAYEATHGLFVLKPTTR